MSDSRREIGRRRRKGARAPRFGGALLACLVLAFAWPAAARAQNGPPVDQTSGGLHGYVGFRSSPPPKSAAWGAGVGFYAAVWSLIDQPIAGFQIGLTSTWITPDNSDDRDQPLAPVGTYARDHWPERGPTYASVFQTVEGGLGYWAGNRFRYGPPKFSMNGTPQCYDYEIGSPGWSFFRDSEALPDDRLGIAQLSNRILIPPDALPFAEEPQGRLLGQAYLALPFTDSVPGKPPTGDQAWTCFLCAANFKGPIAYYIPETWSKIGALFDHPYVFGRGLDARPGLANGGAMEINTVPRFEARDAEGVLYSKIPALSFPVDSDGRSRLLVDLTYYSRAALFDAFLAWRKGGPAPSGRFAAEGSWLSPLRANPIRLDQGGVPIDGLAAIVRSEVGEDRSWGLSWQKDALLPPGRLPQYFKEIEGRRLPVAASRVPAETKLTERQFRRADRGRPYTSPNRGAWADPGPVAGPFQKRLADGSLVTFHWYRFVDQPSFQQYRWGKEKKDALQSFIEKIHACWGADAEFMAPPSSGNLVHLDPALMVVPPPGLERGYVPIVTRQEAAP